MTSNKKKESVHSHLYFRIWIRDIGSHGWNAVTYGQIYSRYGRWSEHCETSYREKIARKVKEFGEHKFWINMAPYIGRGWTFLIINVCTSPNDCLKIWVIAIRLIDKLKILTCHCPLKSKLDVQRFVILKGQKLNYRKHVKGRN